MSSSARGAGRKPARAAPIARRSSPSELPRVRSAGPSSPSSARAATPASPKGPSVALTAAWTSRGAAPVAGRSSRKRPTPARPADRPCARNADRRWPRTRAPVRSAGLPSRMYVKRAGRSWPLGRAAAPDAGCNPDPHPIPERSGWGSRMRWRRARDTFMPAGLQRTPPAIGFRPDRPDPGTPRRSPRRTAVRRPPGLGLPHRPLPARSTARGAASHR